jgi:hypothetical protein
MTGGGDRSRYLRKGRRTPVPSLKTQLAVSELKRSPYTTDEGVFNADYRSLLRLHGLSVLHVRETDIPGAFDLCIWRGTRLLGWSELKIGNEELRPSQKEFARAYKTSPLYVIRLWDEDQALIQIPVLGNPWEFHTYRIVNFRTFDWRGFYQSASLK